MIQSSLWIPYFALMLFIGTVSFGVPNASADHYGTCASLRSKPEASRKVIFITFIVLLSVMAFCSFKSVDGPAIDEWAYRRRFADYAEISLFDAVTQSKGEYINDILVWLASHIFSTDQGIFIVFGGLTALFYVLSVKKYCRDYSFGIVLLMVVGIISTSFNITQQSLACAVFLYFSDYIYERKIFKFLLVVLACYFIHESSVILVLFYFAANTTKKPAVMKPYITLIGIGLAIAYNNVPLLVPRFPVLENYVSLPAVGHAGTNIITIVINCVPALVALIYMNRMNGEDRITALSANLCFAHAGIYLASTYDLYIARLSLFTSPFIIVFLSRIESLFDNENHYLLFKLITVSLYSIELFIRMNRTVYAFNFSL